MSDLSQPLGIIIPIDEIPIVPIPDKICDSTRLGDNNRNSTAESLSGSKQKSFFPAVTQQNMTPFQTVPVTHCVEVEGPDIQAILHSELPGKLRDCFHCLSLHSLGVVQAGSFCSGPSPDDKSGIFRKKIWQGHEPLILKRAPHPSNHDPPLRVALPFRHTEFRHGRRKNSSIHVTVILNPVGITVHDLLRNTGYRHSPLPLVSFTEIAPSSVIPRVKHQRGWAFRKPVELAVTQEP